MNWAVRVALFALVLASYAGAYQHGRSVERTQALLVSTTRDSGERLAEAMGERGARQEEQRRVQAQEEARAHAHEQTQMADVAADSADAAGQRLQHAVVKLASSVSCTGSDTTAVARSQAATRAAMVLSDLLTRADARAGELAKAYDRARIAGEQCTKEYDALTQRR